MRNLNLIILTLVTATLFGCGSGRSNTPAENTQYNLQNYSLKAVQTNNCSLTGNSVLNCDSKGTFGGIYSISFNTPNGKPGAYVIMPPSGNTFGLNIAATSGGCNQSAPQGGQTYTCNFTIGVNGTAQAGNTVHLQVSGALGNANIVTINIQ